MTDLSVDIESFVEKEYHLTSKVIAKLSGYEDLNYVIRCSHTNSNFVLKVINEFDSRKEDLTESVAELINSAYKKGCSCPSVKASASGQLVATMSEGSYYRKSILLSFIDGLGISNLQHLDSVSFLSLCARAGEFAGELNSILKTIRIGTNGLTRHDMGCKMENIASLRKKLEILDDSNLKDICSKVIYRVNEFCCGSKYDTITKGIIHGDLTLNNMIFENDGIEQYRVVGAIDFMDASMSCYVFEVASTICSAMHEAVIKGNVDPFVAAEVTLRSYCKRFTLVSAEIDVLYDAVLGRFCILLVFCGYDVTNNEQTANHLPLSFKVLSQLMRRTWKIGKAEWEKIVSCSVKV